MIRTEDYRENKDGEEPEATEQTTEDTEALKMKGVNPLAEEESVKEDDTSGD